VLAVDLKGRGVATADQLFHRLSWFMLPFTRGEIWQILESARRAGIVTRMGDNVDALGRPVSEEWALTEEGRKLKRPRALSLPDLGLNAIRSRAGFSTVFSSTKDLLLGTLPFLTIFLGAKLDLAAEGRWVSVIAGAVVLGTTLVNGAIGDLKLQAAAQSWPRMREERPARYRFQLSRRRLAFIPGSMIVLYAIGAAGVLLLLPWWRILIAAAIAVIAACFVYLFSLRKMRKAWSGKHEDLLSWEQKWRLRGPAIDPTPPDREAEKGSADVAVNDCASAE
jgi:hypothetical protein